MSDSSQGPGWWQDTDGKWYPPRPDGEEGLAPTEPLPAEPDDLVIRPMSDPPIGAEPPPEPTAVIPTLPPTGPAAPIAGPTAATTAAYAQPNEPEPPWYKENWWVVALVALLLAGLIIWLIVATGGDDDDGLGTIDSTTTSTSVSSTSTPASTSTTTTTVPETTTTAATTTTTEATTTTTEAATTTEAPTTTTAPTTEAPTTTVGETTVPPTTVPPPSPPVTGSGNDTPSIVIPGGGLGVASITNSGPGPFAVSAGPNALIDGVEGNYNGTIVIPAGTTSLAVTADPGASWSITVAAPGSAKQLAGNASGNRPEVLLYTGDGGAVTLDPDDLVLTVFDANGAATTVSDGGQVAEGSLVQVNSEPGQAWTISVG